MDGQAIEFFVVELHGKRKMRKQTVDVEDVVNKYMTLMLLLNWSSRLSVGRINVPNVLLMH